MLATNSFIQPNWTEKQGIMRLFREAPSQFPSHLIGNSFSNSSAINTINDIKESSISLIPFSIYKDWFAVGMDYFEEVFERKRIYNYGFAPSLTKGLIVKDNEYYPVVDLPKIINLEDDGTPLEIMILLSDSSRKIVIEAGKILRPEKLYIGFDESNKTHYCNSDIILNSIKLGKLEVYVLNTQNLINKIEEEYFD